LNDLGYPGRKVHLFQGEKNSMGRVVYLSDDASVGPKLWLRRRDQNRSLVFYGQGNKPVCYSTGRSRFVKYIQRAGLEQKGYNRALSSPHVRLPSFSTPGCAWNVSSRLLGPSGHRGDPPLCPAHGPNPRGRVFSRHGHYRKGRDRWTIIELIRYRRALKRKKLFRPIPS